VIKIVFGFLGFINHLFFTVAFPDVTEKEETEWIVFSEKLLKPNLLTVKAQFLRFCKLSD
jgi:hypothetical protein